MDYKDKLRDPRWQKKRLQIMERDNFKCKLCGDDETTLNIHHKKYVPGREPWDYPDDMLETTCEDCHQEISNGNYKGIHFENIRVKKYKKEGKKRIMLITHPAEFRIARYDENNKQTAADSFNLKIMKDICDFLTKSIDHG